MKESKFQNEQFKIAGVAENNSKFKIQNSKLKIQYVLHRTSSL